MRQLLVVGTGGFLGAVARWGVGLLVARVWQGAFPLATLLVNVSGCFVLGLFSAVAAAHLEMAALERLFVGTGFVGAYTTFSTFELETASLARSGALGWGIVNVLASVVAGYVAVRIGLALGHTPAPQ